MTKRVTTSGVARIATERQRQIASEGYGGDHDDTYRSQELAAAAASYALPPICRSHLVDIRELWPWDPKYWKPTPDDRIRELEKAGALIAAEIDRLLRLGDKRVTGPEVTTGADLQHLPATMLQPVSFDDSLDDSLVPYESAASRRLTAERDQARRIAASLEADLARILDALDAWYNDLPDWDGSRWRTFREAVEAAREWVGRDTG